MLKFLSELSEEYVLAINSTQSNAKCRFWKTKLVQSAIFFFFCSFRIVIIFRYFDNVPLMGHATSRRSKVPVFFLCVWAFVIHVEIKIRLWIIWMSTRTWRGPEKKRSDNESIVWKRFLFLVSCAPKWHFKSHVFCLENDTNIGFINCGLAEVNSFSSVIELIDALLMFYGITHRIRSIFC
jgi:hypothetical protein